jgi:hypothetical protein
MITRRKKEERELVRYAPCGGQGFLVSRRSDDGRILWKATPKLLESSTADRWGAYQKHNQH